MRQIGVIITVSGTDAVAEVERKSACDNCHGKSEDCAACSAFIPNAKHRVTVHNSAGAVPGDRVILEASSGRVLSLAFLAFILPLILAFGLYFPLEPALGETYAALAALGLMMVTYTVLSQVSKRAEKKRRTVTVVSVIEHTADSGNESTAARNEE